MFKRIFLLALPLLGVGLFFAPAQTHAMTATLVSITPDATQMDISMNVPSYVTASAFIGTSDETYTVVYSVDETPAMVVTPGGDMDLDHNWSYDASTGLVTVILQNAGVKGSQDGEEVPAGMGMFIVALMGVAPEGEDGPPASMIGGWLATDIMNWELVPPSADAPYFGFSLSGTSGDSGFLHMFIPSAVIDEISGYIGKTLTPADMAVFENNDQSSASVTDVDGSAYIDINVVFSDDITSPETASATVTKEITAGAQLDVSLAATKYSVSKGKKTTLYGWLKSGKADKTVTVWRKLKGEDSYTKIETLTTETDGYFSTSQTVNKTAHYKIKYKKNSNATAKYSPVQKVTVS